MTAELPPLIVTATLDTPSFIIFDGLRRKHFPTERNFLSAHLTLFHHLPGEEIEAVTKLINEAMAAFTTFATEFSSLRFLGRGVAVNVESIGLHALRRDLAGRFDHWLRPQDRQKFQPHITIQNKVEPPEAKALFESMQTSFEPFSGRIEGIAVWDYLGGPWRLVADLPLSG